MNVLVGDQRRLYEEMKEIVRGRHQFRNDIMLVYSEFAPSDLTQKNLEKYHEDQQRTNQFQGSFGDFIKEYNLRI